MPHIERSEGIEAFILAKNPDDMLDMHKAAGIVDGAVVEILPQSNQEEREAAVAAYKSLALAINRGRSRGHLNPEGWADQARAIMKSGGYVIRLSAEPTQERPAEDTLSLFYTALGGIRRVDAPPPFEAERSKDDRTHNL
jgi:hypothetical protein